MNEPLLSEYKLRKVGTQKDLMANEIERPIKGKQYRLPIKGSMQSQIMKKRRSK